MKFKDLPVGQWFDFAQNHAHSGIFGPYKKTGKRTYLYHSRGWYETKIGTVNLDVVNAERPDNAPAELVDIAVDFNGELNGYVTSVQTYKVRDQDPEDSRNSPDAVYADDQTKHEAMLEAIRNAKSKAESLTTGPIEAETVIVFLEGNEYLIVKPHEGKAKTTAGVGNPRHNLNRKRA